MKELAKMVVVLTVFAAVSAALLAWTNSVTSEPIAKAGKAEKVTALKRVLPPCDNDPLSESMQFGEGAGSMVFHVARKGGEFVGAAFVSSAKGYGGPIQVVVGVKADGTIQGVEILDAPAETPGLGAKVREAGFLRQFQGRQAADTRWAKVRKDGGEIDAVTGATISSRAVAEAVRRGLEMFAAHLEEMKAPKNASHPAEESER